MQEHPLPHPTPPATHASTPLAHTRRETRGCHQSIDELYASHMQAAGHDPLAVNGQEDPGPPRHRGE